MTADRSREIADAIEAAIRANEPGFTEQLPSQRELAERFGVGRTAVVSAYQLLAERHLIVRRQGGAARVKPRAVWRRQRQRPGP